MKRKSPRSVAQIRRVLQTVDDRARATGEGIDLMAPPASSASDTVKDHARRLAQLRRHLAADVAESKALRKELRDAQSKATADKSLA